MAEEPIIYFAETDFRGTRTKFGIKPKDRLRHMYVIGKTGMGKSTLLENLAIQDIRNGNGVGFIDPHGGTAEKLLDYVPKERINDVIYFAPFDTDFPISFNVMEDVGKDQRHLVASGLMAAFKKIWPDVWSARMEYILNNILLALLEYPDSTLLGVNRMLSDKSYRDRVVAHVADPAVKAFWTDEFARYTDKFMTEAGAAIQNKIGQFTSSPVIRNIIGQPRSTFDIRKIMDEKKILIMNLSKGRIGEGNAALIGGMLITKIYLAAMSRAEASASELAALPPFYFYVDEFQTFVNESFADILAEARKYKLALTIAHQYIEQMPEEVRNAVFGNVGTTIAFRVGPFDAEVLEKIFGPKFMAQDLVNLGFVQTYLTLMIDGVGSAPFSARTLNTDPPPPVSYREAVLAASRGSFAHPRAQVEDEIMRWHQPVGAPGSTATMPSNTAPSGSSVPRSEPTARLPVFSGPPASLGASGKSETSGAAKRRKRKNRMSQGPVPSQAQTTAPMNLKSLIDSALKIKSDEELEDEEVEAAREVLIGAQPPQEPSIESGVGEDDVDETDETADDDTPAPGSAKMDDAVMTKKIPEIPEEELRNLLRVDRDKMV